MVRERERVIKVCDCVGVGIDVERVIEACVM